jgi:hypothetical protein
MNEVVTFNKEQESYMASRFTQMMNDRKVFIASKKTKK